MVKGHSAHCDKVLEWAISVTPEEATEKVVLEKTFFGLPFGQGITLYARAKEYSHKMIRENEHEDLRVVFWYQHYYIYKEIAEYYLTVR